MRTIEVKAYQFSELSDKAKEQARDWYKQGAFDYDWWDFVYDDAAAIAKLMGIDVMVGKATLNNGKVVPKAAINFSGFWSQGDGACFESSYTGVEGAEKAVKDYAPQDTTLHAIARELDEVQAKYGYGITGGSKHTGRYSHSGCMTCSFYDQDDNEIADDDAATMTGLFRDFADWIYRQLEKEYDWLNSDEQVDESITANEYEFDEDGKRI